MQIKKKLKIQIFFLLAFALIIIPSASALTFNNTTFFSSESNSTIFVDSITLDNVTVTANFTEFFNLTSLGSNFTNTNVTDAFAHFIGLNVGLVIRNINTSTDLFLSTLADQDFNATFTAGQLLRIVGEITPVGECSQGTRSLLSATLIFLALAVLLFPVGLIFVKNDFRLNADVKSFLIVFISIILAIALLVVVGDLIRVICP